MKVRYANMLEYRKYVGHVECSFVEMDPTGRYGRYNEVLGKGASKIVYKAFDEIDGMEVAWNQVKLTDVLRTPDDLERLYCEVHLLRTLKHKNIMKFYTSWVDTERQNINFITEMFTSGTLKEYRQKHKRVDIRAIKNWARQILRGLLYLHSHDPPIIHRDLKCDNIFVNGNLGEVKIGDLGLAAVLHHSHAAHNVIGTPEFMAPELYEENYNELVDIYAFGMCLLEMLTCEYPYTECSNPAQIYKKVTSGIKPEALNKVKDPEVRQFVEKCLATASKRLPARDLLTDPFLQCNHYDSGHVLSKSLSLNRHRLKNTENEGVDHLNHENMQQMVEDPLSGDAVLNENENATREPNKTVPFLNFEEKNAKNKGFTIKGKRTEDDTIFLRVRIIDKEGLVRNIHFPFDVENDTAMSVASEMVAELDITDYDDVEIAAMIDEEISALVPNWKEGVALEDGGGAEEGPSSDYFISKSMENGSHFHFSTVSSENSLRNYLTSHNLVDSARVVDYVHGRFEEVIYQVNGSDVSFTAEDAPTISTESSYIHQDGDEWLIGEEHSSPSSPFSSSSGAGKFLSSDESQSCSMFLGSGNRHYISRFNKRAELTAKTGLSGYSEETWEEADPDCSLLEYCGFESNSHPEGSTISPHHEQDWLRPAYKSQCSPLFPTDPLSDDDENSLGSELRLLSATHERELKELQRKHELSILEISNHLRNDKGQRESINNPSISPISKGAYQSQILKNGYHHSGHHRRWKPECQITMEDMLMEQCTAASTRNKTSGKYSSRSSKDTAIALDKLPIAGQAMVPSLPRGPANKKSTEKWSMKKIRSFSDIRGESYLRSLAAQMSRLRLYQTIGAVSTEKLNSSQNSSRPMMQAPSAPRKLSAKDHMGRVAK